MDRAALFAALDTLEIETPSWGFADSGTRFGVFPQAAAARTLAEKIEDAATVHRFTACCPRVALHIPWDDTDDWDAAAQRAAEQGIAFGAINPNVFQEADYRWGSFAHPDPAVRQRAIDRHLRCIEIAGTIGSRDISCWFADGTNYPGQDDFRARRRRFADCFATVYEALATDQRLLIEYKFFEPAFYHTDLCDWGQCALLCRRLGERATVLVDTGHHAQGVNIQHIVASLLDEGLLGGFHFNSRKYADDDLTVGSIDPYEIFLIFHELVSAGLDEDPIVRACAAGVSTMFDQSHNLKGKVAATIQSACFVQEVFLKALLVDRMALRRAQAAHDLIAAEECLRSAFFTDVRPGLADWRTAKGLDPDPLQAFERSGDSAAKAAERQARHGQATATSGYQ